jgi:hypothetical protein
MKVFLTFLVFILALGIHSEAQQSKEQTKKTSGSFRKRWPRIGIFLPFSNNEDGKIKTENIVEFYKGMVAANDFCTSIDSGMRFQLFDHRNLPAEIIELSEGGCLDGLDLMVGPVKQSLIPVFDSVANAKGIPVMNVLSHAGSGGSKTFSGCMNYQQPSYSAIARTCIEKAGELGIAENAVIIFGPERKDTLVADEYRRQCLAAGKNVLLFHKIDAGNASELGQVISAAGIGPKTHIFIANNETQAKSRILSQRSKCPVFIYGNWLERSGLEFDDMTSSAAYFVAPDLPVPPCNADWLESYVNRWGTVPSWVAWKGFDLVMMLADAWYGNRKNAFEFHGDRLSVLFGKYRYGDGTPENQFVPVYRFDKKGFSLTNP